MIKKSIVSTILLLAISNVVQADNTPEIYPWSKNEAVLTTEKWLKLQREGQAGSMHIQAVTLAEQEKIMDRWLKSYDYALPEFFDRESAGEFTP